MEWGAGRAPGTASAWGLSPPLALKVPCPHVQPHESQSQQLPWRPRISLKLLQKGEEGPRKQRGNVSSGTAPVAAQVVLFTQSQFCPVVVISVPCKLCFLPVLAPLCKVPVSSSNHIYFCSLQGLSKDAAPLSTEKLVFNYSPSGRAWSFFLHQYLF